MSSIKIARSALVFSLLASPAMAEYVTMRGFSHDKDNSDFYNVKVHSIQVSKKPQPDFRQTCKKDIAAKLEAAVQVGLYFQAKSKRILERLVIEDISEDGEVGGGDLASFSTTSEGALMFKREIARHNTETLGYSRIWSSGRYDSITMTVNNINENSMNEIVEDKTAIGCTANVSINIHFNDHRAGKTTTTTTSASTTVFTLYSLKPVATNVPSESVPQEIHATVNDISVPEVGYWAYTIITNQRITADLDSALKCNKLTTPVSRLVNEIKSKGWIVNNDLRNCASGNCKNMITVRNINSLETLTLFVRNQSINICKM